MNAINRQVRLANRPEGMPQDSDWQITEEPVPTPGEGELVVAASLVSLDPAMRGWIREGKSYIEPVEVGAVMRAIGLGKVVASNNPRFEVGEMVSGMTGIQQYCLTDGKGWQKIDPSLAPLPTYLSCLGMPGMTAYFGLLDVGLPKEGDVVVVSAASGAVGSVVGQIAKIKGCTTVGIAGGEAKCKYVKEVLGYDEVIDYKSEKMEEALKRTCPKGMDIYFDNVGGEMLDACLGRLRMGARIVVCGAISQYNKPKEEIYAPKNYLSLLVNRARMEGMVVLDYAKRYRDAAMEMGGWMMQGKLKTREHIDEGIENFPASLRKLFTGENFGKLILKVDA